MSISFADSLKKSQTTDIQYGVATTDIIPEAKDNISSFAIALEDDVAMASDDTEGGIAAYAGDTWTRDDKYAYYPEYSDEVASTIDTKKNIVLDANQYSISQETRSQFILFEMNRFYDGYDLQQASLLFHFVNRQGYEDYATPINVSYSSLKLRFGWLLDERVTSVDGKVRFEIQALGVNSKGERYVWKTRPFDGLNILQSLTGNGVIEPSHEWMQTFLTQITEEVQQAQRYAQYAQSYSDAAVGAVDNVQRIASNVQGVVDGAKNELAQSVETEVGKQITVRLEDYYTQEEILTLFEEYEIDDLHDLVVEYDGIYLTFKNGDKIIKTVTIHDDPSDAWVQAYNGVVDSKISTALEDYYTQVEINSLLDNIDISEQLTEVKALINNIDDLNKLNIEYDGTSLIFKNGEILIKEVLIASDPTQAWVENYTAEIDNRIRVYTGAINDDLQLHKQQVEAEFDSIHRNIDDLPETLNNDYYKKTESDARFAKQSDMDAVSSTANTNKQNVTALSDIVVELQETVDTIDKSPRTTYEATYDEEYIYTLWEITGEGDDEVRVPKGQFKIVGGGGGGTSTSSTLKIDYITKTPFIGTTSDKFEIFYNFSGTDSSGDPVSEGIGQWRVGTTLVGASHTVVAGENSFDLTEYINTGSQRVTLTVTDDAGSLVTKSWTVQKIDVRIATSFNDKRTYDMGNVVFDYVPYGAIEKTVHFILDNEEIGTVVTSASGVPMTYTLPAQEHGSHLLEVFITATVNNNYIESEHILKDILWFDESSNVAVIGATKQEFSALQYETTNIDIAVFDPKTEIPTIQLIVDNNVVSTMTLTESTFTWSYKSSDVGEHILKIKCGTTEKILKATIEKLDIELEPVAPDNLVFDFDPAGRTNGDVDRLWKTDSVAMTVSDNFDWINGGYQIDENGDSYFCIKAGTTADIDYKLFADDAKRNGKEFKLIFKTTNIAQPEAVFLSCVDNTTGADHIGVEMKVHQANIYGGAGVLELPYSEEDVIEFEFNIAKNTEAVPMVMGYEDGVSTRPMVYGDSHSFTQNTPKTITLGSEDCDLHIYRFKVYNTSLNARGILNNFIADARTAEEMIDRYNRNEIYDENGNLNPDILAEKCPHLRIYKLSAPYFTNNKDDKVKNTTIQQIYKAGDPILDNWTAYNVRHSGQGTSSNNYGAAARNLDFIMNDSGIEGVSPYFKLSNGREVNEITLTRESIPVAYLNFKANVASSNHMTNALLAGKYNEFQPYRRPFIREDGTNVNYIKDTMEFHNAVVFIQETDPDISTHREFADNEWHLYSIGNIGDSKKTDKTRKNDINDPYECIVEIMDVNLPLSDWPVNTMYNAMGYKDVETSTGVTERVYTWAKDENLGILHELKHGSYVPTTDEHIDFSKTYYVDILEHDDFSEDFTYGWRYISNKKDPAIVDVCKRAWIEFYRFVTTSSDEEFRNYFSEYMVLDSALYNYLFTTRYCMVDNRAKNTFWHFAKTGVFHAVRHPVDGLMPTYCELVDGQYIPTVDNEIDENKTYYTEYAFDLNFDYDNDTALGLNNYGKQVYRYGLEDIDKDANGEEIFRESDSTFFCRLRDLFAPELKTMYQSLSTAWHAESFINKADAWQSEFPEELWRLHIERVYIRTYTSSHINGEGNSQFLVDMCNGKMKYHRRQWERSQEQYMASKYQSSSIINDAAVFRCTVPTGNVVVAPNYRLKLMPYAYMYLNVKYGTQSPIQLRAEPNKVYEIPFDGNQVDILHVYGSSLIQDFGDLSSCYPATADTSKASKIKRLIIGNSTPGYSNPSFTNLTTGANTLLEVLNVENLPSLTQELDLKKLKNLRELYAHGTNITGVSFANGGMIELAELPALGSLSMNNLAYLTTLDIESLNNLTTISAENCNAIDLVPILESAPNVNRVRLINVDWNLADSELIERIYVMKGIDKDGWLIDTSVLTGRVHVPQIREQRLNDYRTMWPDLHITYSSTIPQYPVMFVNEDGTLLEVQYVDKGGNAIDISKRANNPIIPKKESTEEYDFVFKGWDTSLEGIFSSRTLTAVFEPVTRLYTVRYLGVDGVVLQESQGAYGSNIPYDDDIPVYTAQEAGYRFYLFDRWDKSGLVDGDKDINAIWETFSYEDGAFDGMELSTMRPVEVYAMSKMGFADNSRIDYKDRFKFTIGNDFIYDDVYSQEIISELTEFTGAQHIDTGISLFEEDRDFTIAIDFEMLGGNTTNAVLMQCYQDNGSNGFKLRYSPSYAGSQVIWGSSGISANISKNNVREVLVIRHTKGTNHITLYNSNIHNITSDDVNITTMQLDRGYATEGTGTLVIGSSKSDDGRFENHCIANVYWCKIWFHDLGERACTDLAMWTHEDVTLEVCGFRNYYLADSSNKKSSFTMLAAHALDVDRKWNATNTNVGGWANSSLKALLNKRLYNAFPPKIRQMIQQVRIPANLGSGTSEVITSNDYVTLPALIEVLPTATTWPYVDEGIAIPHMVSNSARLRTHRNGVATSYWTRSANVGWGDRAIPVNNAGYTSTNWTETSTTTTLHGIVIEISV